MYRVNLTNPIEITKIDNAEFASGWVVISAPFRAGFKTLREERVSKTRGYFETREEAVVFAKTKLMEKYHKLLLAAENTLNEMKQLDREDL